MRIDRSGNFDEANDSTASFEFSVDKGDTFNLFSDDFISSFEMDFLLTDSDIDFVIDNIDSFDAFGSSNSFGSFESFASFDFSAGSISTPSGGFGNNTRDQSIPLFGPVVAGGSLAIFEGVRRFGFKNFTQVTVMAASIANGLPSFSTSGLATILEVGAKELPKPVKLIGITVDKFAEGKLGSKVATDVAGKTFPRFGTGGGPSGPTRTLQPLRRIPFPVTSFLGGLIVTEFLFGSSIGNGSFSPPPPPPPPTEFERQFRLIRGIPPQQEQIF